MAERPWVPWETVKAHPDVVKLAQEPDGMEQIARVKNQWFKDYVESSTPFQELLKTSPDDARAVRDDILSDVPRVEEIGAAAPRQENLLGRMRTALTSTPGLTPSDKARAVVQLTEPKATPASKDQVVRGLYDMASKIKIPSRNEELKTRMEDKVLSGQPLSIGEMQAIETGAMFPYARSAASGAITSVEGAIRGVEWLSRGAVGKEMGDRLQKWAEQAQVEDPNWLNEVSTAIGSTAMYLIPGMGVASYARAVGAAEAIAGGLGTTVMAALEAQSEGGFVYRDVLDRTGDEAEAHKAAMLTFWLNLPVLLVTDKLGYFTGAERGLFSTGIGRRLVGGTMEGVQEGTQGVVSAFSGSEDIKWKDVLKDTEMGAVVGILFGGAGAPAGEGQKTPPPTDADVLKNARILYQAGAIDTKHIEGLKQVRPDLALELDDIVNTDLLDKAAIARMRPRQGPVPLIEGKPAEPGQAIQPGQVITFGPPVGAGPREQLSSETQAALSRVRGLGKLPGPAIEIGGEQAARPGGGIILGPTGITRRPLAPPQVPSETPTVQAPVTPEPEITPAMIPSIPSAPSTLSTPSTVPTKEEAKAKARRDDLVSRLPQVVKDSGTDPKALDALLKEIRIHNKKVPTTLKDLRIPRDEVEKARSAVGQEFKAAKEGLVDKLREYYSGTYPDQERLNAINAEVEAHNKRVSKAGQRITQSLRKGLLKGVPAQMRYGVKKGAQLGHYAFDMILYPLKVQPDGTKKRADGWIFRTDRLEDDKLAVSVMAELYYEGHAGFTMAAPLEPGMGGHPESIGVPSTYEKWSKDRGWTRVAVQAAEKAFMSGKPMTTAQIGIIETMLEEYYDPDSEFGRWVSSSSSDKPSYEERLMEELRNEKLRKEAEDAQRDGEAQGEAEANAEFERSTGYSIDEIESAEEEGELSEDELQQHLDDWDAVVTANPYRGAAETAREEPPPKPAPKKQEAIPGTRESAKFELTGPESTPYEKAAGLERAGTVERSAKGKSKVVFPTGGIPETTAGLRQPNMFGTQPGENEDLFDMKAEKPTVKEPAASYLVKEPTQLAINFHPIAKSKTAKFKNTVKVRMATTGRIMAKGYSIRNAEDAASLVAKIRKSAQEEVFAIAVAKDGRVIEIHRYSKGDRASALVQVLEITGHLLDMPEVAKVYSVHNHPSFNRKASGNDSDMAKKLASILDLKKIESESIVIAGRKWSLVPYASPVIGAPQAKAVEGDIRPSVRKVSLPVKERKQAVTSEFEKASPIKNGNEAVAFFRDSLGDAEGFLFTSTGNVPVAFWGDFKGKDFASAAREVIPIIDKSNAVSMIFNSHTALTPERSDFIAALKEVAEIGLLDVIENGVSRNDVGKALPRASQMGVEAPFDASFRTIRNDPRTMLNVGAYGGPISESDYVQARDMALKVRDILSEVLPRDVMEKIDVEIKPVIDLTGRKFTESMAEHGGDISNIFGATTIMNMKALVEVSSKLGKNVMEDTAYHEAFHVAASWVIPADEYAKLDRYFNGNQENMAKAFAAWARKRPGTGALKTTGTVRRIFAALRRIFARIANGLRGKGFTRPEDVFQKLMGKAYAPHYLDQGTRDEGEPNADDEGKTWFSGTRQEDYEAWARDFLKGIASEQKAKGVQDPEKKIQAEQKHFNETFDKTVIETAGQVFGIGKEGLTKTPWGVERVDTTMVERILASPEFYFQKVPAAWRVFEAALERRDAFNQYFTHLTEEENPETGRRENLLGNGRLERLQKADPAQYEKLKKIILSADKYRRIHTPDTLRRAGLSEDAIRAWQGIRATLDRALKMLQAQMNAVIKKYEDAGQEPPAITRIKKEAKTVQVSLRTALDQMGSLKGWYFPRQRRSGRFALVATKGEKSHIEFFDLRTPVVAANRGISLPTPMERKAKKFRKAGWTVEIRKSNSLPEDVFEDAARITSLQAMINSALAKMNANAFTLNDFGLRGTDRTDEKTKDFVVSGPMSKQVNAAMKALGGQFYADNPGEPRAWHFVDPPSNIEAKIVASLGQFPEMALDVQNAFAQILTMELSNLIRRRGFRSSMTRRGVQVGEKVWSGYETDPLLALTSYARNLSAGFAKRDMAEKMVKAITGTDIPWDPEVFKDYDEYRDLVKERRIDPATQRNAYRDVTTYMEEQLRNQELPDGIMGAIKSVAVLKYLGFRVASAAVNLTALATSVPGSMRGYAGINEATAAKNLVRAANLFRRYRFGPAESIAAMDPDTVRLFDHIHENGWANSQYNAEALGVLKSRVGRGWNKALDMGMFMFGVTESINRAATIAGTYLALRDKAGGRFKDEVSRLAALAKAKEVSDRAHGTYGPVAYPHYAQGKHLTAQLAKAFYVFGKFSHTYLQTMYDLGFGRGKKDRAAMAYMMFSPMILAGSGAMPLIWKPLMWILAQITGSDDPEEGFYAWVAELFGDVGESFARFGLVGLGGYGVSLKGSLAIESDLPTTIPELFGAPWSAGEDLTYGVEDLAKGNVSKGLEKALPSFVAGPLRGVRERTEGVTTRGNAPIFYGENQLKANWGDMAWRFFSFNPAHIAGPREKQWHERQTAEAYKERSSELYAKMRKYWLAEDRDPKFDPTAEQWFDIMAEVEEFNQKVAERQPFGISPIKKSTIKGMKTKTFRAPKSERERVVNE